MNRKYNKSNANSKKTKADQITVTFRTCGNTGNMNAAKVTLLLAFTPTSAGLGTQFASLANYIAMYELFRIESSTFRVMPRPLVTGVLPPWIIGYVPFGGNAPTDFTSFENYKQSTLTPGYQIGAAFADAYPTKSNMATLQLSRADLQSWKEVDPMVRLLQRTVLEHKQISAQFMPRPVSILLL